MCSGILSLSITAFCNLHHIIGVESAGSYNEEGYKVTRLK
jgi:hypothetical protein